MNRRGLSGGYIRQRHRLSTQACLLTFLYWESLQEPGKPYPLQVKMAVGSRELSWMFPEWSQSPSRDVYMMTEASSTDQCHTQLSNRGFCQVLSICKSLLLAKHALPCWGLTAPRVFDLYVEKATKVTPAGKQPAAALLPLSVSRWHLNSPVLMGARE